MSKPRYRWWGFVRQMIRDYPQLSEDWAELHSTPVTASFAGAPSGAGGIRRTVESIALKQMPVDDQRAYDAVSRAIENTQHLPEGKRRLDMIRLTYWVDRPMPLKSAALRLYISERTAKRWHGEFVRATASAYGFELTSKVGTPEPK